MKSEDEREILDLISGYGHSYDRDDMDALIGLFDDDAITNIFVPSRSTPFHTTTTRSQLRKEIGERRASLERQGIQLRHFQTNTILTEESEERILGRTVLMVAWQRNECLVPKVMHTGIYEDEFRRTPSGWRFVRRDLHLDHELPTHPILAYLISWIPKFVRAKK